MSKKRRIIITGGNGFIGTALREKLAARGYSSVISPNTRLSNRSAFTKILQKNDIVVHLACSSTPAISERNPQKDVEENLLGTLYLLDACREKNIRKFIFASSGGTVYGNIARKPSKESDPTEPKNSHGVLKLAIEKYIGVYKNLCGMDFAILRIGNPYGRKKIRATPHGAVDVFLQKILAGKPIEIWGDGRVVRDYIHIDDVTDFILRAIEHTSVSGVYNVGTGKGTSLNALVKTIERATKKKSRLIHRPQRGFDLSYNVLAIKKARATGWKPRYTLSNGLRNLLATLSYTL